jgi:hypothetical protein
MPEPSQSLCWIVDELPVPKNLRIFQHFRATFDFTYDNMFNTFESLLKDSSEDLLTDFIALETLYRNLDDEIIHTMFKLVDSNKIVFFEAEHLFPEISKKEEVGKKRNNVFFLNESHSKRAKTSATETWEIEEKIHIFLENLTNLRDKVESKAFVLPVLRTYHDSSKSPDSKEYYISMITKFISLIYSSNYGLRKFYEVHTRPNLFSERGRASES